MPKTVAISDTLINDGVADWTTSGSRAWPAALQGRQHGGCDGECGGERGKGGAPHAWIAARACVL
eukprot:scaffold82795_cov48-Phaeocystis_antarctica.AAC.1